MKLKYKFLFSEVEFTHLMNTSATRLQSAPAKEEEGEEEESLSSCRRPNVRRTAGVRAARKARWT
jgi:hypothetical protein